MITVGICCQSMITDDPAEYYEWQQEQEHMEMLVEQYHAEQLQRAEHEMSEILGCLQRVPEYQDNLMENAQTEIQIADQYLTQIKQILAGANKAVLATILQPLNSAMSESEWLLEAGQMLVSQSREDNI